MINLQYPWMLLTLLCVPLLAWRFLTRRRPSVVVSSVIPARRLSAGKRKLTFPEICVLISMLILSVALARPRQALGTEVQRAKGLDIVLAIDLSGSMQAIDRPADMNEERFVSAINSGKMPNRLAAAKEEIRKFVEARPNDRIGLIGFADLAYSFVPPTLDHALLLDRLESLEIGEVGEQTGIASPIGTAVKRLKNSAAPRRVMVLFTDGANTAQNQLTPQQAAELAKEFNVIIHTVGIGGNEAYAIATTPFGLRLVPVNGSYDAQLLHDLAKITGGSAFHAADRDGLKQVMREINALEKTNIAQPSPVNYREFAPVIALIALAVLLLGIIAQHTWKMRLP